MPTPATDPTAPTGHSRHAVSKIPISVLVVVHTAELEVLLLERADRPGWWQSVTGSKDGAGESLRRTACREVFEETGIVVGSTDVPSKFLADWQMCNTYEILPAWRHRYDEGVGHNVEHVFSLCVPRSVSIRLAPAEHTGFRWLGSQAAADACFSHTNASAIRQLPLRCGGRTP